MQRSSETSLNNDISSKNIAGKCNLKCAYSFTYSPTQLISKNRGVVLSLTPDKTRAPPVTYNLHKYSVDQINIIHPSKHLYNGRKTDAEFIIIHTPILGGKPLHVCIPIVVSGSGLSSEASESVTQIIADSAKMDKSTIITKLINLSNIVPNRPYFSYANDTNDALLFAPVHGIMIQPNTLETLKSTISPNIQTASTPNGIFFNKNGPNSSADNSGIYISCQPTGHSEEEVNVTYSTTEGPGSLGEWFKTKTPSAIITYLAYMCILIACLMLLNYIFSSVIQ
jgi:hypothetical protein